jgi:hypothetical protein
VADNQTLQPGGELSPDNWFCFPEAYQASAKAQPKFMGRGVIATRKANQSVNPASTGRRITGADCLVRERRVAIFPSGDSSYMVFGSGGVDTTGVVDYFCAGHCSRGMQGLIIIEQ